MPRYANHRLSYVSEGVTAVQPAAIDANGDVIVEAETVLEYDDVMETYVFCETCRKRIRGGDPDHGLTESWEDFLRAAEDRTEQLGEEPPTLIGTGFVRATIENTNRAPDNLHRRRVFSD